MKFSIVFFQDTSRYLKLNFGAISGEASGHARHAGHE